jgi:hypothetical protein
VILPTPSGADAGDIIGIMQLASYAEAMSRFEFDEAVLVYADDGVLASPTTEDAVGREAIAATIRAATDGMDLLFQTVGTGLVRVDGDRREAGSRSPNGGDVTTGARSGFYEDRLVRATDGWRFTRRYLQPITAGGPDFLKGRVFGPGELKPWQ